MKLLKLPQAVLDDLADEEKWRLDIRPLARMLSRPHPPTPYPQFWGEGSFKVTLPSLGEGFRERARDLCKKSIEPSMESKHEFYLLWDTFIDFYMASYYHFSDLIGAEYERSQALWG